LNINGEITTANIFRWVGYAVPFITIPAIFVVLTKRYLSSRSEAWPVIAENERYKRLSDYPWHIYTIVALGAFLIGGIVLFSLTFANKLLKGNEVFNLIKMMQAALVWSGVVFLTAGFIAYRIDSPPNIDSSKAKRIALRISGALTQGVATAFWIYIAAIHTFKIDDPLNLPAAHRGKVTIYSLIGFLLGTSIYAASGFGRLRQRRKSGRRNVGRPVQIYYDSDITAGETVNVSNGGTLIECHDNCPEKESVIKISDEDGTSALGRIVMRRGNKIHVNFEDEVSWKSVQGALNIQPSG